MGVDIIVNAAGDRACMWDTTNDIAFGPVASGPMAGQIMETFLANFPDDPRAFPDWKLEAIWSEYVKHLTSDDDEPAPEPDDTAEPVTDTEAQVQEVFHRGSIADGEPVPAAAPADTDRWADERDPVGVPADAREHPSARPSLAQAVAAGNSIPDVPAGAIKCWQCDGHPTEYAANIGRPCDICDGNGWYLAS